MGALFPLYFGVLALAIGVASLVNGRLVMKYGMRRLSNAAAGCITLVSLLAWAGAFAFGGLPPLWLFMTWLMAVFVCVGLIFGREPQRARDGTPRPRRRCGGGRWSHHSPP